LDSLTPKTYPQNQTESRSCHSAEVISIQSLPAPPHNPGEQPISKVGGGLPPCSMFGMDVLT